MIWLLSLICLALPTYLVRFNFFGIPTTLLEILIYVGILLQISIFFKKKNLSEAVSISRYNILVPIGLFLLAGIISAIVSPDKRVALGILKGWIIDPILLFGLILLNIKKEDDFKKIIFGLSGGAAIVALWGILQAFDFSYLLPHQRTDPSFISYLQTGRAFGPFESPNYLGMYLVPISILSCGYLLVKRSQNFLLIFSVAVSLLALFFTKSLGSWFGFFMAFLVLIYLWLPKSKRRIFLGAIFLLSVLAIAALFHWKGRIESSFVARKEVWQVSWYLIKKHPIFGIGLGNFPEIYNQTIPKINVFPMNWMQMHPHNIFIAFWLYMGILGLLSFVWLLVKYFQIIKNNLTNQLRPIAICLMIPMAAILIHGLIDTTYWKNDLSAMFWVIMGLAWAMLISPTEKNNEKIS